MRPFHLFISGLLICLLTFTATAQEEKWEGGFFLGFANYSGDLAFQRISIKDPSPAFGFMVKRNLSKSIGLRLGLISGKLVADEKTGNSPDHRERGFSFENQMTELSLLAHWKLLSDRKQKFSPYLFAGVGLGFSNPKTDFNNRTSPSIITDMTADAQKALFTVPLGIGASYSLNRKWIIGFEVGTRPAFNDYVDGVSIAGNPGFKDWYAFSGLTLTTRFGAKDSDGDGITDENDKCPNTPGLSSVGGCPDTDLDGIPDSKDGCPEVAGEEKFNGCPDSDGDDVADNQDNCPNIPGERRYRGCPDSDGDGISDPLDICPNIPGVATLDGCPDADGDGITDADDACPELAGSEDTNGCPDTDGDGIVDPQDKCPFVVGTDTYSGCPDTDGDGIGDGDDACPSNAGPASNDGCPVIAESDLATLELAMSNVRFRTNSDEILTISYPIMDEVAEIMTRYPNYNLTISGYTDNVGNAAANQSLSERRARSCYQYLLVKGISRDRISHAGFGETNPIEANDTPTGRARNRRVEFELVLPK